MQGCLRFILGAAGFWVAGALVTWILPLGETPRNASEQAYHRNAREMRGFLNNNPIAVVLTRLLVLQTQVSDLRYVQNSCDSGTDAALAQYKDVVATVTDYAIWAVPVQRYGTSCAGLLVWRGRPDYRSPRNRDGQPGRQPADVSPTAPPLPPPPPPPPPPPTPTS